MESGGQMGQDYQYQNQTSWEEITRLAKELNSCEAERDRLRAALEGLYNGLDSCVELTPDRMRAARAAIAKARGVK